MLKRVLKYVWGLLYRQLEQKGIAKGLRQRLGIRESLGLPIGAKLLDCGCGIGIHCFQAMNDGFKAYGFDTDKNRIKKFSDLKSKLRDTDVVASFQNIPFNNDCFDVVWSNHVLEHVRDDEQAIKEIWRVLKKDCWLILTVPNIHNVATSLKRKLHYANPFTDVSHLREYDESELRSLIMKNGFEIVRVDKKEFLIPIVDRLFHLLVLYLGLSGLTRLLSQAFPYHSLEIVLTALKK